MRRLLLLSLLFCAATAFSQTIVQTKACQYAPIGVSFTCSWTSPPTSGHGQLIAISSNSSICSGGDGGTVSGFSISDGVNSFGSPLDSNFSGTNAQADWYVPAATGGASSITIASIGGTSILSCATVDLIEISQVSTVDVHNLAINGDPPVFPSVITTNANDIVIGVGFENDTTTLTASAGWTVAIASTSSFLAAYTTISVYANETSTGTYQPSATGWDFFRQAFTVAIEQSTAVATQIGAFIAGP